MMEAVDALAQEFVFLLQKEVFLLQLSLFLPETPEVKRPSFAQSSEKRQRNEKAGEEKNDPALRSLGSRHNQKTVSKNYL